MSEDDLEFLTLLPLGPLTPVQVCAIMLDLYISNLGLQAWQRQDLRQWKEPSRSAYVRFSSQPPHQAVHSCLYLQMRRHFCLDSLQAPGMHVVDTHTHGQGHIHTPDTPKDIHRDTHTHTTEINLRKWQHIAIKHLWFCFFVCFLSEFSSVNCVSLHKYRSSPSCSSLPNVEFSIFCQFPHGHQWRIKLLSPLASLLVTVTGRGHRALSFHVCAIPESNS